MYQNNNTGESSGLAFSRTSSSRPELKINAPVCTYSSSTYSENLVDIVVRACVIVPFSEGTMASFHDIHTCGFRVDFHLISSTWISFTSKLSSVKAFWSSKTNHQEEGFRTYLPREMLVDRVAGCADHLFQARATPHLREDVQGPLETAAVFPRSGSSDLPWLARLWEERQEREASTHHRCCHSCVRQTSLLKLGGNSSTMWYYINMTRTQKASLHVAGVHCNQQPCIGRCGGVE